MKGRRHIQKFNEHKENLNTGSSTISDVSNSKISSDRSSGGTL